MVPPQPKGSYPLEVKDVHDGSSSPHLKGRTLGRVGVGETIMDKLYFQGVRPFRLGGEPSWTSFTSKVRPIRLGGGTNAGWAPNAAPATQTEAAPNVINRCRISADLYEGAPSAAPATNNVPEGLQMPHVHAKRAGWAPNAAPARWAPNAAPATQTEAAPKVINRRRTSVDRYEVLQVLRLQRKTGQRGCCTCNAKRARGAPSAAPARQNELDGLQMPCLPRKPKRRPM